MTSFPFPIRLAAGLAVATAQRARQMPKQLVGLPVTMASQALQASMRVQQNITELAIRGDEALATLRPVEAAPSWATFDEDLAEPQQTPSADDDPWAEEERALAHDYADGSFDSPRWAEDNSKPPAGVSDYDELTLPQLRARLRQFSAEQLEELLAYERAHDDRASFTGMLARRIDNVRKQGGSQPGQDGSEQ